MGCAGSKDAGKPKQKKLAKGSQGPVRSAGPPAFEEDIQGELDLGWLKFGKKDVTLAELIYTADEFKTLIENEEALEQVAQQAFRDDDRDENGTISKDELKKSLVETVKEMEIDVEVNDEFVDKHFEAIDKNADDALQEEEYKTFVKQCFKIMNASLQKEVYDRELAQEDKDIEAMENDGDLEDHLTWVILPDTLEALQQLKEDMATLIKDKDEFSKAAEEYFVQGDENEDQVISVAELKNVLNKICGDIDGFETEITEECVQEYFNRFDYNEDQSLDESEFFDLFKTVLKEIYAEITWGILNFPVEEEEV